MREYEVRIEATGERFTATEDETVLAAALRAGIPVASSCRSGTCRTCMCVLIEGTIAYTVEWPGLSPDEKAQGWILPCVARPSSPIVLGRMANRPWWEQGR